MTDPQGSFRRIIGFQIGFAFVAIWLSNFIDASSYALSILGVSVVLLLNWGLLKLSWGQILLKKSIALGIALIVTKYALLASSIYWLSNQPWFETDGWIIGVSILTLALLSEGIFAYWSSRVRINGG